MQKIYYQSQMARIGAGTILLLFGLSPLILVFYLDVVKEGMPVTNLVKIIFNADDLFPKLVLLALYVAPATAGFMFIKNSRKVVRLEFRDDDVRYVCLPKVRSKGDIWAMGFGYWLDYKTIPYKNIKGVEITGKRNARRIKIETGKKSQILNIMISAAEAEEIKQFIERKIQQTPPAKSKRPRRAT